MDRQAIKRAREGKAYAGTFGRIEEWLDKFEHENESDPIPLPASEIGSTIELPNGIKVTFSGTDPEGIADVVMKLLSKHG